MLVFFWNVGRYNALLAYNSKCPTGRCTKNQIFKLMNFAGGFFTETQYQVSSRIRFSKYKIALGQMERCCKNRLISFLTTRLHLVNNYRGFCWMVILDDSIAHYRQPVLYWDNHHLDKTTDTIIHGCKVKKILCPKTAGQPSHFDIFRPRKDRRSCTSLQLPK